MFRKNIFELVKIWLLHYIIYYWLFVSTINLFSIMINKRSIDLDFILIILISPITAMFGLYDGMFFLIPLILNYLLMLKYNLKKSFYITIFFCYLSYLAYLAFVANFNFTFTHKDDTLVIKNYLIVIPCLSISILINNLFFKKD